MDDEYVLIFTGMVNPRKRINLFVDVLSRLKNLSIRLLLVIRGEKEYINQLKDD